MSGYRGPYYTYHSAPDAMAEVCRNCAHCTEYHCETWDGEVPLDYHCSRFERRLD